MNDTNLQNIKNKYNELHKTKDRIQKLLYIKENLENSIELKRYYSVLRNLRDLKNERNIVEKSDFELLDIAIKSEKIEETNNIYVYICTIHENKEEAKMIQHKVYANLENNGLTRAIILPIEECDKFEEENIVLYSDELPAIEYYNQMRNQFFNTALTKGQDEAVSEMARIRNRK